MSDSDYRLAAYALGVLEQDERAQIEQDLESDASLRLALSEVIATLDDLAMTQPTATPSQDLRARILDSTQSKNPFAGFAKRLTSFLDLGAQAVTQILESANYDDDADWEPGPIPGIQLLHFQGGPRVAQADCGLVKLDSGCQFPEHRHLGDEWALVLQGEVLEDDGSRLLPGDISYRQQGSHHSFTSVGDDPLILVVVLHEGFEIV